MLVSISFFLIHFFNSNRLLMLYAFYVAFTINFVQVSFFQIHPNQLTENHLQSGVYIWF